MKRFLHRFRREEQGEIAVLLACYMIVLLLCMALVMDLGNTYLSQLKLRNAVDLAATSIAVQFPLPYTEGKIVELQNTAESIVELNGIDLNRVDMTCEILQDHGQIYAARLILDDEVIHFFGQMYINRISTIRAGDLVYITPDEASASGYSIVILDS